jgi:Lar family restriction alleviation protein
MKSEEFITHEPCVKCGSKRQSIRYEEQATEGTIIHQVYCQDCEAVGPVEESRAKAIELWDLEQKATRNTK